MIHTNISSVGELIKALQTTDPNLPLAISIFGHTFYSQRDELTHGRLSVAARSEHNKDYIVIFNLCTKELRSGVTSN